MKIASISAAFLLVAVVAAQQKINVINKTPNDIWVKIPAQGAGQNDGFMKIRAGLNLQFTRENPTIAYVDQNDQRDLRVIRVDPGNTYQIGADLPKRTATFREEWFLQ
ncbi:hypothetical protein DFQ27_009892 [Actinomortierella ambigua]|uniref:Uncharacterized protein n=1 Tax=Actinomortierella ambigua TaxID=1343610 RepID=A0A9P6QHD9_9FUNG|nr:hypothetical protein DFQ27_009892 [Actinomortierella ambigua]